MLPLTSVSAVWSRGGFFLNRSDSGFGLVVLGVIVPIPPHTPNIIPFFYTRTYLLDLKMSTDLLENV